MIERLAALEHEQWAHWTRYMLDNLTPENIERWNRQIQTPYTDLTETEKDSDREWASKVLDVISKRRSEIEVAMGFENLKNLGESFIRQGVDILILAGIQEEDVND